MTGGKHCRLTTTSAAPRDRHMECRWQNAWWRQVVNSSPRASTPGGHAMEAACRTTLPHQRRQWSLPQLYVCMSACCRRLRSMCRTWMVSDFAFDDSITSIRPPHILWMLFVNCTRWTPCALARSPRYARFSREIAFASGGGRSRRWCQNACAVQLERARSAQK